jgi:hypothetical protein
MAYGRRFLFAAGAVVDPDSGIVSAQADGLRGATANLNLTGAAVCKISHVQQL